MYIVDYIIQSSAKCAMAQKALENKSQAFSSPEVTVEPNNFKSLLADNKSNPHKESISAEFLSDIKSDIPMIYSSEAMKEAFCKRKWSTNKPSTSRKQSKKIRTNAKFLERMSKPTRLYLLRDNDFATRVKHKEIKQISKRELDFGVLFPELCTVL